MRATSRALASLETHDQYIPTGNWTVQRNVKCLIGATQGSIFEVCTTWTRLRNI